jgi:hypothetical protein
MKRLTRNTIDDMMEDAMSKDDLVIVSSKPVDSLLTAPDARWRNPEWLKERKRRLPQPLSPSELKKLADESKTKNEQ